MTKIIVDCTSLMLCMNYTALYRGVTLNIRMIDRKIIIIKVMLEDRNGVQFTVCAAPITLIYHHLIYSILFY